MQIIFDKKEELLDFIVTYFSSEPVCLNSILLMNDSEPFYLVNILIQNLKIKARIGIYKDKIKCDNETLKKVVDKFSKLELLK